MKSVSELLYHWLGESPVPYMEGWELQRQLHERVAEARVPGHGAAVGA